MHDNEDKEARVSGRDAHEGRTTGTQGEAAQRPGLGGGGGGKDAPPTNRASHNCNPEYFRSLRWGVDSLYLSYPGKIFPEVEARLKNLKQFAQAPEPNKQAQAQYPLGEHLFEVKDKGASLFPYILEDNTFRIQLARPSKVIPMAYVKIASGYLSHVSPADAGEALSSVLAELGEIKGSPNVSRIDLFVDFVSFEDMESWTRHAWVTRATAVNTYAVDGKFSGWSIGTGGIVSARLYNKRLEIETSGKRYLFDLWRKAGWTEGEPVWRLEFELKREALTQRGLFKLGEVLGNLNGLWSYATTEWLRLTLLNPDDQTRSRWPIHPLWGYLSSIDWETPGGPLLPRYNAARVPGDDKLFGLGLSTLISFMAREGVTDLYRGQEAYIAALYEHHEKKSYELGLPFDSYIAEKVALKAREFNTILNNPDLEEERKALERKRQAEAYRKASKGE
jgi:hypothetical protein